MSVSAIAGIERTELIMKYILSQQPVELAVLSSVSVCLTFQTPVSNTTLRQSEGETRTNRSC